LIRYSNGAPLKKPFYNDEVQQRGSGERARWLAALLIVTSIAATSVLVRVWPVDVPTPALASRRLPLYATPVLVQPTPVLSATRTPARRPVATAVGQYEPTVVAQAVAEAEPVAVHEVAATAGLTPEPAPVDVAAAPDHPLETAVPQPADNVPILATVASPSPPQSASRGLVELPAVAVTRAVMVAGRGIRTGLRATTAAFRAAF
jgi:hypothetical protein